MGDVKYKDAPANGILHADLYQFLSYVIASDLPWGLLVYGAGGVSAVHQVALLEKKLEVASLDLAEPPEGIRKRSSRKFTCTFLHSPGPMPSLRRGAALLLVA